jgi:acyl carrier protein
VGSNRNTRRNAYDARAMSEDIEQRVIRLIAKNKKMAPEGLSPATRFDDLKMDSLDALNMIFALEEEFDFDFEILDVYGSDSGAIRRVI